MPNIKILDPITASQIAAGEVVERPASVVKELCENSLDAGASVISINIRNGGISLIEVSDNGSGIGPEDLGLAFCRHATSKLNTVEDFNTMTTMGFRGEALASIASVSKVTMRSRRIMSEKGHMIYIEGGEIITEGPASVNEGTYVTVGSLFYNTPARYKFLKKDSTEASYIADIIERFILARPDVSYRLVTDNKEILHSPGNNDLKSAVFAVYGKDTASSLLPVEFSSGGISVSGYTGNPSLSRKTRQQQSFFVNGRYIKSALLSSAVEEGYKTLLMKGQFAFCVLNLIVDPSEVDVNVHPQKTQVKFRNEGDVFRAVAHSVKDALIDKVPIQDLKTTSADIPEEKTEYKTGSIYLKDAPILPVYKPNEAVIRPEIKTEVKPVKDFSSEDKAPMFIEDIAAMKYVGAVFDTFLIFESGNEMVIIDQHAAHERILFEEILDLYTNDAITKQVLLIPEIIEFPPSMAQVAEENFKVLDKLGFECERFGPGAILLRTVPLGKERMDPSAAFRSVTEGLGSKPGAGDDDISGILFTMACKAAVKAHDKLKPEEIEMLIERLAKAQRNTHCPHGRPVSVRVSHYEIEKWFKRVVS